MLASKNVYCDNDSMMCIKTHNKKNVYTSKQRRQKKDRTVAVLTLQKRNWGMVCWSPSRAISSRNDSQIFHVLVQCFNCKTSVLLLLNGEVW